MSTENRLKGLCIKSGPLGENDRLITILSEEEGISRFAVPGARRPKSTLASASPLTYLDLQIFGRKTLKKVRQLRIIKSYCGLGRNIETLSTAQAITELTFLLVGNNDAQHDYLSTVLIHLDRIYDYKNESENDLKILAMCIQSVMHLLAIGGLSIPVHFCYISGKRISPPVGDWEWNCYFVPDEGFTLLDDNRAVIKINASEMALLQRLLFSKLPIKSNGDLLGPKKVWKRILSIIEYWILSQLGKELSSLKILREIYR